LKEGAEQLLTGVQLPDLELLEVGDAVAVRLLQLLEVLKELGRGFPLLQRRFLLFAFQSAVRLVFRSGRRDVLQLLVLDFLPVYEETRQVFYSLEASHAFRRPLDREVGQTQDLVAPANQLRILAQGCFLGLLVGTVVEGVHQVLGKEAPGSYSKKILLRLLVLPHQDVLSVLVLQEFQLPLQSRVEVVLYVVVRSPGKQLGDLRPLVSHVLVQLNNFLVFFFSPLVLLNIRVQVVVPPNSNQESTFPCIACQSCQGELERSDSSSELHTSEPFEGECRLPLGSRVP